MATAVSIADVFVQITSKLDDVFTGIDKMAAKLDELSTKEVNIKVNFDTQTEEDITKIATGVERITSAVDKLGSFTSQVLTGLGVNFGQLETTVSRTTKKVATEVDQATGGTSRRLAAIGETMRKIFNPTSVAMLFSVAGGLALLAENGFSVGRVLASFGGEGSEHLDRLSSSITRVKTEFNASAVGDVTRSALALLGVLAPKAFGLVGVLASILKITNGISNVLARAIAANPESILGKASNLINAVNNGLLGMEFRLQAGLARVRLYPAILALVGASVAKIQFGLTGVLSFGPLIAAGMTVLGNLFRLLSIKAARTLLLIRARFGDGAAQFQLFLLGLRQLGPIFQGLSRFAQPLGLLLERLSELQPGKIMGTLKNTMIALLNALESIVTNVQRLVDVVTSALPKAVQNFDKLRQSAKKLNEETKNSGRGPPGGTLAQRIFGAPPKEIDRQTKSIFARLSGSISSGFDKIFGDILRLRPGARRKVTDLIIGAFILKSTVWFPKVLGFFSTTFGLLGEQVGDLFTSEYTPPVTQAVGDSTAEAVRKGTEAARARSIGAISAYLAVLRAALADPARAIDITTTLFTGVFGPVLGAVGTILSKPLIWKPLLALAVGAIVRAAAPFMKNLVGQFKAGFVAGSKPIGEAIRNFFGRFRKGAQVGGGEFADEVEKQKAPVTTAFRNVATASLAVVQTLMGGIFRSFGAVGFSGSLLSKAADNFNKSGLTPFIKRAFRLAGAVIPGLFGDLMRGVGLAVTGVLRSLAPKNVRRGSAFLLSLMGIGEGGKLPEGSNTIFDRAFRKILGAGSFTRRAFRGAAEGADPVKAGFTTEAERIAAAFKPMEDEAEAAAQATAAAKESLAGLAAAAANLGKALQLQAQRSKTTKGVADFTDQLQGLLTEDSGQATQLKQQELQAVRARIAAITKELQAIEGATDPNANRRRKQLMEQMNTARGDLLKTSRELATSTVEGKNRLKAMIAAVSGLTEKFPALKPVVGKMQGELDEFSTRTAESSQASLNLLSSMKQLAEIQQTAGMKTKPLTALLENAPGVLGDFLNEAGEIDIAAAFKKASTRILELSNEAGAAESGLAKFDAETDKLQAEITTLKKSMRVTAEQILGAGKLAGDDVTMKELLAAQRKLAQDLSRLSLAEQRLMAETDRARAAFIARDQGRSVTGLEDAALEDPEGVMAALTGVEQAAAEVKDSLDVASNTFEGVTDVTDDLKEAVKKNVDRQIEMSEATGRVVEQQKRQADRIAQSNAKAQVAPEFQSNEKGLGNLLTVLAKGGVFRSDVFAGRNRGNTTQAANALRNAFSQLQKGSVGRESDFSRVEEFLMSMADDATTAAQKWQILLNRLEQSDDVAKDLEQVVGAARQISALLDGPKKGGLGVKEFSAVMEQLKGSAPVFAQIGTVLLGFERLKGTGKGLEGVLAPFMSGLRDKGGKLLVPQDVVTQIQNTIAGALVRGMSEGIDDSKVIAKRIAMQIKEILQTTDVTPSQVNLTASALERTVGQKLKSALNFRDILEGNLEGQLKGDLGRRMAKLVNTSAASFAKMGQTIGESMKAGKGNLKAATIDLLEWTAKATRFRSPPTVGPLSTSLPSFKLMGGTIGQAILRGAGDLRSAVTNFLQIGTGDIFVTLQQLILAPFALVFKTLSTSGKAVSRTVGGALTQVASGLRFIPILGGPISALGKVLGGVAGKIVALPLTVTGALGSSVVKMLSGMGRAAQRTIRILEQVSQEIFRLSIDARRAGVAIEEFETLARAGEMVDVQATEISQAFIVLRQNMSQAVREGAGPMVDAFNAIGLTVDQLRNTEPSEVFVRVAAALKNTKEGTEEYNQVLEILGASMTNLRALLSDPEVFSKGIEQARAQLSLTQADADSAKRLVNIFKILNNTTRVLRARLVTALDPLFIPLEKLLITVLPAIDVASVGFLEGVTKGVKELARFGQRFFDDFLRTRKGRQQLVDMLKGAIQDAVNFLLKQIDKLISKIPQIVSVIGKRALPSLVTFFVSAIGGAVLAGINLAPGVADLFGLSDDFKDRLQDVVDGGNELVNDLTDGLVDKISGVADDITGENPISKLFEGAENADPLYERMRELRDIIKQTVLGDIPKGVQDALESTEEAETRIDSLIKKLEKMNTSTRVALNGVLSIMSRSIEVEDQINQLASRRRAEGGADTDARRRLIETFQLLNKVQNQSLGLVDQISARLKQAGADKEFAEGLGRQLRDVLITDFGSVIEKIGQGATPEQINALADNLQDALDDALRGVDASFDVDLPTEILDLDLRGLLRSLAFEMTGIEKTQQSIAGAQSTIQELTSGWTAELGNVGTGQLSLELQFLNFAEKVKNANETAIRQIGIQLGLEQATADAIIERAELMKNIALEARKAANELRRIDEGIGLVKGVIDGAGNLAGAFDLAAVMAKKIPAQVQKTSAELANLLLQDDQLLDDYREWLNISGDIAEVVKVVGEEMQRVLEVSEEIRKMQELKSQFDSIDQILQRVIDSSPFQALRDGMADARLEAFRTGQELKIANKEVNSLVEIMARRAPEKLVTLAKELKEAGIAQFDFELTKENAERIPKVIADATEKAMNETLRNIQLAPLAETVRETVGAPLVTTFAETLRGLADGSIFEAARAAKEQAREAGVEFSKALFVIGEIGKKIFESGLDNLIAQFQERLTDALTQGITEGILSTKVFGALDQIGETTRRVIGAAASALLAVTGLVLSRLQSTANVAAEGIESAIQSSEAVRGVISGDTSVSVKEQQENLKEAVEPVVDRLDVLIALTKTKIAQELGLGDGENELFGSVAASGL